MSDLYKLMKSDDLPINQPRNLHLVINDIDRDVIDEASLGYYDEDEKKWYYWNDQPVHDDTKIKWLKPVSHISEEEIKQPIEEDKDFQLKLKDAVNVEFRIKIEALEIENKNLKKQLREQIAAAAMSNDALLELNRKVKENVIDKAIEWCDSNEKKYAKIHSGYVFEEMKQYLQTLK